MLSQKSEGGFLSGPAVDVTSGLDRCLESGLGGLARVAAGLVVGWWVYVPLHELLHAFGCIASGGTVSRLEIGHLYGGALFARLFPFVTAGSEYAGRLSGFDTGGSDAVYLVTDLGPYLLTVFPGVFCLRRAGGRGKGLAFGFWLPFALAPFISLTGDAYEIGSILVTRLAPWAGFEALRGDDVFRVAAGLGKLDGAAGLGLALAFSVGVLWAFATYGLGRWVSAMLHCAAPVSPTAERRFAE